MKKITMKKKTMILITLNVRIAIFVLMSITIYYLVPIANSGIDYLRKLVGEFIRLFI